MKLKGFRKTAAGLLVPAAKEVLERSAHLRRRLHLWVKNAEGTTYKKVLTDAETKRIRELVDAIRKCDQTGLEGDAAARNAADLCAQAWDFLAELIERYDPAFISGEVLLLTKLAIHAMNCVETYWIENGYKVSEEEWLKMGSPNLALAGTRTLPVADVAVATPKADP